MQKKRPRLSRTFFCILSCVLRINRQHIFNEDTITHRRVVNQHMRHRANQFAVLNNGAAGHSLYNTAGLFQQRLVSNLYDHIFAL